MTEIVRIPLAGEVIPLHQRIKEVCDVQWAAGNRLAGCFEVSVQLILIFQPK